MTLPTWCRQQLDDAEAVLEAIANERTKLLCGSENADGAADTPIVLVCSTCSRTFRRGIMRADGAGGLRCAECASRR